MFEDVAVRQAIVILATALLVELFKWGRARRLLETSKAALRLVAVALVALGAFLNGWQPDGQITLQEWWRLFWPALAGVEFTYQWVMKYLGTINRKGSLR